VSIPDAGLCVGRHDTERPCTWPLSREQLVGGRAEGLVIPTIGEPFDPTIHEPAGPVRYRKPWSARNTDAIDA
jgi:hypothetical protein